MPARRLWRWARDVATRQDLGAPARLEVSGDALVAALRDPSGAPLEARIPIDRRDNPAPHPILKVIHGCEVGGRRLEAESPEALRDRAAAALEAIAPGGELPVGWFVAPATGYEVAIHRDGPALACPVLRAKAPTVAALRAEVTRRLVAAGQLHPSDEPDVQLLRAADLRRLAPVAVLRSAAAPDTWLPCVADRAAQVVRTLDPVGGEPLVGATLLALLRAARERTRDETLHAAGVDLETWQAAAAGTRPSGAVLRGAGGSLELYVQAAAGSGDVAVAVDDGGVHVFLAHDAEGLAAALNAHLKASGRPGDVRAGGPTSPLQRRSA